MKFTGLIVFVVGGFLVYWALSTPRSDNTAWLDKIKPKDAQ